MFWSMTGFATNSSIEALLDRDGYTLEEVLDDDCLLAEVKSLNKRLLNFLQDSTQVRKMIQFVISKPPDGADEKRVFRYSFLSCAVISCEIDVILKTIVDDEKMLDLLFSFLQPEHDHGSLLAGYFSKVVVCLLLKKTEQVLLYIQDHRDIVSKLVDLIGITSIMEVLVRFVDIDDNRYAWDFYTEASIEWLAETDLVDHLIDKLSPDNPAEVQANAATVLSAVTRLQQPALGWQLAGFVGKLFSKVLNNTHSKSTVVHSLSVCISLLDPKRCCVRERDGEQQQPTEQPPTASADALDSMLLKLSDILKLLDVSNDESALPTTYGELRPPLGIHRLKIVEFIAALLKADTEKVGPVLVEHNTFEILLGLFFNYPFNNMLHHRVESVISLILERNHSLLIKNLLKDCDLVSRILSADSFPYDNHPKYSTKMSPRIGNIGHLTRIANKLTLVEDQNQQVRDYLKDNLNWQEWKLNTLQERNAVENVYQWACGRPMPMEDRRMDSDEDDCRDRDYDLSTITSNVSHEVFRYGMFENPDGEEDIFFDDNSAEMVMNSLRLSDEQESARLIGHHSSWFSLQEGASNGSGSSSSDDDEVVLDDFLDAETSCRERSLLEDETEEDENDGSEALHTLTIVDITAELQELELTENCKANDDDGESSQFDGGTRAGDGDTAQGLVLEMDMLPEARNGSLREEVEMNRDVKQLAGLEPDGTAKAMEKALKEGVVGEAAPLHQQPVKPTKLATEDDDSIAPEMADLNYWKSDYDQSMIAELEKV